MSEYRWTQKLDLVRRFAAIGQYRRAADELKAAIMDPELPMELLPVLASELAGYERLARPTLLEQFQQWRRNRKPEGRLVP